MRRHLGFALAFFASMVPAQTQPNFDAQIAAAHPSMRLSFNDATTSFKDQVSGLAFTPSTTGTILARQPGSDNTWPDNTSGSFTFDSYATAPNSSIGSFEWNQAFSIHTVVNGLTTAPAMLLSKGALVGQLFAGIGYDLAWDGAGELCFQMDTQGPSGSTQYAQCAESIPTGYNLDIWVTYDGTGICPTAARIYVNGLYVNQGGYLNANHFACRANPSPGSTMIDSSLLHVPGNSSGEGGGWGSGGAPLRVDEADLFPGVVSQQTIAGSFLHMKFYRALLSARPAVPPKLIVSDDGAGDLDNLFAIQLAIAAHKLGYVKLVAVTDSTPDSSCAFYRQMLDAAGLNHIPVARTSVPPMIYNNGAIGYLSTTLPAYNASTDTNWADYPDAPTLYRKIVAGLAPGEKIVMMYGGSYLDLAEFMQTPGDSISPLTGAEMFARVAYVNLQGMTQPPISAGVYGDNGMMDWVSAEYVVTHNGNVPLNWYGGTPVGTGGLLWTRPASDPNFQFDKLAGDNRMCWDCLPVLDLITDAFRGAGVEGALTYTSVPAVSEAVSTTSNIFFYPFSALYSANENYVYQWFVNSLVNPLPEGKPRGAE